jgi:glutathione S-transferase
MLRLIIGNKAYSSWSMRAWLAARQSGLAVENVLIPLYEEGSAEDMRRYAPTGKVPCLMDGAVAIWDSLAICEYLAELAPEAGLWPTDRTARAVARAACAEMHSAFPALRRHMPMNLRKTLPGKGWPEDAEERAAVDRDVARVERLWETLRTDYGTAAGKGPFLFGAFTIADCFYAPVVTRLETYGVPLGALGTAYRRAVLDHPSVRQWTAEAQDEPWVLPRFEK